MKAKSNIVFLVLVGALITLWRITLSCQTGPTQTSSAKTIRVEDDKRSPPLLPFLTNHVFGQVVCPSKSERWKMCVADRLDLLERMGSVPADGDVSDYNIAQKTSWWGRRLDPVSFWSNRVVWLDEQNMSDANRRGRGYPPIPFVDPRFDNRDDTDEVFLGEASAEGPGIQFHDTNREGAFWDRFGREHPRPPSDLARRQQEEAEWLSCARDDLENRGNPGRLTIDFLAEILRARVQHLVELGYPVEAFSENVLHSVYITQMTAEYQSALAAEQSGNTLPMKKFKRNARLGINTASQPITEADSKARDAWKVAYLRRLREQKTDESYINAYVQSWGLDAKAIFKEP